MSTQIPPVTVDTPGSTATITTTTIQRRSFKLLALNIVSAIGTSIVAVLGYLQTVNLSGVVTPEKALLYVVAINVANIVLRQWFSPPQQVETRVESAPGGQG